MLLAPTSRNLAQQQQHHQIGNSKQSNMAFRGGSSSHLSSTAGMFMFFSTKISIHIYYNTIKEQIMILFQQILIDTIKSFLSRHLSLSSNNFV